MRIGTTAILFLLILWFCPISSISQRHSPSSVHPKIGLVLEGGSALGLAHIGVLKWLEEHHVPIHYVAGTSMGGLVGGVYATGLSATEVQELVKPIDWDQVLRGQTPYKDLSFRRKEDVVEYPNDLEFGIKKGVQFPAGFNAGQQVVSILDRVALPYSSLQSFNDLPIPFACVGTDLTTAKQYVFRKGSLSLALRSTMSLPGIFTPVHWEGHIFADGGLLDNLPVDVAKNMGADLTIAVHLEAAGLAPDASLSSIGVLVRSMKVVVAANELRSMEEADILISVPLQRFRSMDFSRFDELIQLGYEAAQSKATILNQFSVDETTWQAYLAERASRRRTTPIPQFVEVKGTRPTLAKDLQNKLGDNVGKPVNPQRLEKDLMVLNEQDRFESLSYQTTEKDGQPGLLVTATEKPYAPPLVRPLILLDGANFAATNFSIGARITFLDFGAYRAEWRSDVMLGTQYRFASEYYRPLSAYSHWFVAPNIHADYLRYPIYSKDKLLAEYRRTFAGGGMQFGYEFNRIAQFTLGYTAAYERFTPKIGDSTLLPSDSGRLGLTTLNFSLNDIDDPVIPRSGKFGLIYGSWADANPGAAHSFPLAEGHFTKFVRLSNPTSIRFGADAGTTFGNELVGVPSFSLGGSLLLPAYGQNELLTNQYYLFRTGYLRKVAALPVLVGKGVYLNATAEVGKVFAPPFESRVPADGALALVVDTIFGPVELGGAVGTTGHRRIFFRLGRLF